MKTAMTLAEIIRLSREDAARASSAPANNTGSDERFAEALRRTAEVFAGIPDPAPAAANPRSDG
jgi:hypothetical protein